LDRRHNGELLLARDAAEQASRAKSGFLATIIPMTPFIGVRISWLIDMLEQRGLKASQPEVLKTIRESAGNSASTYCP
jgi:hypothetical protein